MTGPDAPYAAAALDHLAITDLMRVAWISLTGVPAAEGGTRDNAFLLPLRAAGLLAQELDGMHGQRPGDAELAADI